MEKKEKKNPVENILRSVAGKICQLMGSFKVLVLNDSLENLSLLWVLIGRPPNGHFVTDKQVIIIS